MNETTPPKKRFSLMNIFKLFAMVTLSVAFILYWVETIYYYFGDVGYYEDDSYYEESYEEEDDSSLNCNVAGIELHGELMTYIPDGDLSGEGYLLYDESASENIVASIEDAETDLNFKAIILEIDSVGGGPTAGQEIANALKRATKPTIALIRGYGTSAAYYAATGADVIFASKNSDVGGIGVTMSYLDQAKQNQRDGLTYNSVSSGKYKDYADPDKSLTDDEKQMLMRDVMILHNNFVEDVAANREMDINKVKQLADGSSMPGQMALDNGLIDQLGDLHYVEEYLKEQLGEEIEICW